MQPPTATVETVVVPNPTESLFATADMGRTRDLYDHNVQTIRWGMPRPDSPGFRSSYLDSLVSANTSTGGWWPNNLLEFPVGPGATVRVEGLVRGVYYNDQRIEWSGVEESFAAEAVLRPSARVATGNWVFSAEGEFFLNQPLNGTLLNGPENDRYRENLLVDPFEVFQLYVQAQYGDWALRFGKSRTPFGRYQSPMFTNRMDDAPFLRTDVVSFTETGVFGRYQPDWGLVVDLAVVNGEPDRDTNSSKGGIIRIGWERANWTAGVSAKAHDGISSEHQKLYDNAYGADASVRFGRFSVYAEGVYDEHGFRRDFDALGEPLPGSRSLYGRDVYFGRDARPIRGYSYYAGVAYRGERLTIDGSFGSYYPEKIGNAAHDEPLHRTVIKALYSVTPNLQVFAVGVFENERPVIGVTSQINASQRTALYTGLQFGF